MEQNAADAAAVGGLAITAFFCFGGALVSALIGGLIGNRRDRGILGMFLGFFLGPIGWIGAAFLDYSYRCPFCQGGVPKGSKVCLHCGRDFATKPTEPPA